MREQQHKLKEILINRDADVAANLATLQMAIADDLAVLDYPSRSGVRNHEDSEVANVVIVGGGQSALGIAAGLKLEKVERVRIFEQREKGKAGPWRRFARMLTLRTPKNLPGPNWGIPNLSFRRWFQAVYPNRSWDDLKLIDKEDWASYLDWYRDVLDLEVEYETRVNRIYYDATTDLIAVEISRADGTARRINARRVVLATGIEGSGQWKTPDFISGTLPRECWAHTSEEIDFGTLRGKRVGVLGAGASAFDNAAVSLESGAASVDLCFRRKELVKINTFRWAEYMEFLKHFPDMDDGRKWRFIWKINDIGQLPPHDTYHRAKSHAGFNLRSGTPWDSVDYSDGEIIVRSGDNEFRYDFIIVATGFGTDLDSRPELADFSGDILRWADRYKPKAGFESSELRRHPYLGENFEFLPRDPDKNPWISRIYNYTYGAILSNGFSGASITGMKYSLTRILKGLTGSFYREDMDYHYQTLEDYDEEEF